ncbi:ACP phosphodiesterase [Pelotalea chapellei]|uniref:DUF479 domain-containing protein n=1 Tax=Pelotalea chapellei TaxID=44671 RepID=A0ABS5U9U1_9BACT|nr:ACP phosphodiesterase [Pelotalea chapellei]MBT1072446.1 DUF479 domain-containing protein [Pelotalea chapellei]
MNFLFHLYLSGDDPDILTGNLMGDFVKGRISEEYPEGLRAGMTLHRHIDSFAQDQELFRRSRNRIDSRFGLWRGVLVDLFYDHFLARDWLLYSEMPLPAYLQEVRRVVEVRYRLLPERMQGVLPMMFEEWLPSYGEVEGIGRVLERMARRVRRANPLAGAECELVRNYAELRNDFREFLPLVREFAKNFRQTCSCHDESLCSV